MQTSYDLKRYAVLYVDDEEMALKYFERSFGKEFRILTANNAAEGMKILEAQGDEIGILITDQRMPGEKGVDLLQRALQLRPRLVRMLVTAYADFGVTVDAVNLGSIFRYVSKPIQIEDMRNTLHRAMEFFIVMQERDDLLREKLSVLQNILIIDRVMSLGVLASGIGRHLRHPLPAVQSFLEVAPGRIRPESLDLERLRNPTFWRDFHDLVAKQVSRVAELITGLDRASGTSQKIDPAAVIAEAVTQNKAALNSAGVTLSSEVSALPQVQTDGSRFQNLIEMLLKIDLASEVHAQNAALTARPTTLPNGDQGIQITFRSDGTGIPAEALRSVFDPFFIRAGGAQESGLSLMGVFFLTHHLGGRVVSLSPPGQGLSIVLELPVTAPDTSASESREFVTKVLMNDSLWERLLPQ
jgi:two-component system probable response regulator PhcQ